MTDNHHTNYVTTLTEERVREIVREEMILTERRILRDFRAALTRSSSERVGRQ